MDFEKTIPVLVDKFEGQNVKYALIGGFALFLLGVQRTTVDLDFLVLKEDLPKIDTIMHELGYDCVHRSENVSQFTSNSEAFGGVDFLHAFREISRGMLNRAGRERISGDKHIQVLLPEDLIGLKVQALVNDGSRAPREYPDIEFLMGRFGNKMKWESIKEYFELFNLNDKFLELKDKYAK